MSLWIFKKQTNLFIFFNVFWNLCRLLILIFLIFVSFQFHTHVLHVISYKCKYVLFHLNMLKLFQEIMFFFSLRLK
jgi:hypothetical protein